MKSRFFKIVDLSDTGKRRIKTIGQTEESTLDKMVSWLREQEEYPKLTNAVVEKLANETGEARETLADILIATSFILPYAVRFDDKAEQIAEDAAALEIVTKEEAVRVQCYLKQVFEFGPDLYLLRRKRCATSDGSPSLGGGRHVRSSEACVRIGLPL